MTNGEVVYKKGVPKEVVKIIIIAVSAAIIIGLLLAIQTPVTQTQIKQPPPQPEPQALPAVQKTPQETPTQSGIVKLTVDDYLRMVYINHTASSLEGDKTFYITGYLRTYKTSEVYEPTPGKRLTSMTLGIMGKYSINEPPFTEHGLINPSFSHTDVVFNEVLNSREIARTLENNGFVVEGAQKYVINHPYPVVTVEVKMGIRDGKPRNASRTNPLLVKIVKIKK